MLRLFIMRHAKSSWAEPGKTDKQRTLNARGLSDLPNLAKALADKGYVPDLILCSVATRTQMTLDGIKGSLSPEPKIEMLPALYSGHMNDYINIIRSQETGGSIMIVGHNPNCELVVDTLSKDGNADAFHKIAHKYPTGAISVIDFDLPNWSDIAQDTGHLVDVITPKTL